MTLFETAPYQNLILTGVMGVGKTSVGRAVARKLHAEFFDLENEILAREGRSAEEIRETFGETRLRTLEAELIRDLTLHRYAVLAVTGPTMLDTTNRERLLASGVALCLTCALDEILRRMHVAHGAWFHDPSHRGALLSRLRREWAVNALDLPQLDTTALSLEQTTDAVIEFWLEHAQL